MLVYPAIQTPLASPLALASPFGRKGDAARTFQVFPDNAVAPQPTLIDFITSNNPNLI